MSTVSTWCSWSQSASPRPSAARPSKPEYAAACSPLRKIASNGWGSRLGWNASPSVPTLQCTGQVSTKSGSRAQCGPGSRWWSLVATTTSYDGAWSSWRVQWWSSSPMSLATRAPPSTGSDPPSQKSFCTSTTTSARVMGPRYPGATPPLPGGPGRRENAEQMSESPGESCQVFRVFPAPTSWPAAPADEVARAGSHQRFSTASRLAALRARASGPIWAWWIGSEPGPSRARAGHRWGTACRCSATRPTT